MIKIGRLWRIKYLAWYSAGIFILMLLTTLQTAYASEYQIIVLNQSQFPWKLSANTIIADHHKLVENNKKYAIGDRIQLGTLQRLDNLNIQSIDTIQIDSDSNTFANMSCAVNVTFKERDAKPTLAVTAFPPKICNATLLGDTILIATKPLEYQP